MDDLTSPLLAASREPSTPPAPTNKGPIFFVICGLFLDYVSQANPLTTSHPPMLQTANPPHTHTHSLDALCSPRSSPSRSIIPIIPAILSPSSSDGLPAVSPTLVFVLFSSKSFFQILANPVSGRLVDRHPDNPSRLFAPSLLLLSCSSLLFALGCSPSLLPAAVNYVIRSLRLSLAAMKDLPPATGQ